MLEINNVAGLRFEGSGKWAIEGIISGVSLLWGPPGVGKSFVAISMAVSVATGRPWLGRKTQEGRVVYVAGEGGGPATARRMRAAMREWTVDPWTLEDFVPLDIVTPAANLTKGPAELLGVIGQPNPVLIVIDTLSRSFAGDENSQEFMGAFVRSLDTLRDVYGGCTILVIHHANASGKMRGSTVLGGAADVNWHLKKADSKSMTRLLIPDKLRELDIEKAEHQLRLESVPCKGSDGLIELDQFGEELTTLVVKPTKRLLSVATQLQTTAGILLSVMPSITFSEWRQACRSFEDWEFRSALSLVITYPGQWGIEHLGAGVYAKAVECRDGDCP
jgi:hypothetical protein